MRKQNAHSLTRSAFVFALTTLLAACASPQKKPDATPIAHAPPAVIPLPAHIEPRSGEFVLRLDTPVFSEGDNTAAAYFVDLLSRTRTVMLSDRTDPALPAIRFAIDAQAPAGDEAYTLDAASKGIRIAARTPTGLFYGGITLWQMLTADGKQGDGARVPAVHIEDAPRFVWRGLMMDVARSFRTTDEVKRMLDTMAQHKLNVFHWHLTDDQGWRIEIKKYPKLTQIGGCRIPAGAAGRDERGKPAPYCGFYTQDQIRDVVAYATARHITVVPEIETPGHAQAAIASYPELGVTGKRPPVSHDWGIHTWLYNTDDATFDFLENVLTEVLDLFPGQYIHVGGDEAAKDQWIASPRVQKRKKELGLANEALLQGWFTHRLETWLAAHGRRLIGWDEILEGGLPPEATVMSWRGTAGAIEAAKQGHDVVQAPSPFVYFDNMQSDRGDEPPGRGTVVSLKDVYEFEAVPPELDTAQGKHVLGAQGNLWSEHLRTADRVEHAAFPRAAALAESLWSPREQRDWNGFLVRLSPQMARYRRLGIAAADSAFAVRIAAVPESDGASVTLSSQADFGQLRYTTDGSAPNAASPTYAQPLHVALPATIAAAVFDGERALSDARRETLDRDALYTRDSSTLEACAQGLVLRLEDDAPRDGPRAVLQTDVFNPCWSWKERLPHGKVSLRARVGQLPYNFQLWRDTKLIVERKALTRGGELEVRANACDGKVIATLPLAPAMKSAALSTLEAPLTIPAETNSLCFVFGTGKHDPLWAIDRLQLLPAN